MTIGDIIALLVVLGILALTSIKLYPMCPKCGTQNTKYIPMTNDHWICKTCANVFIKH